MKCLLRTPVAVPSTNMLSCIILLSVFTLSDAQRRCPKVDLSITTPQKMEALSGSCLHVPCSFTATGTLDRRQTIDGLWSTCDLPKNECKPVYNSNGKINKYPMSITGNLTESNCTTLFTSLIKKYSDEYEFRIENVAFRASACSTLLEIKVTDSPPSPTLHVPAELKEAESVTFTCSAPAPCLRSPPSLNWNLQGNTQRKLEQNPDGTFTATIQQTFTLSEQHDGDDIRCSATYPVDDGGTKSADRKETLSVSYAPKDTSASVSPSAVVSAGSSVTLNCSSRAKPPVTRFTWFRRSGGGDSAEYEGDIYTFNVTEGGVYYCVAANTLGNQSSEEIQLTLTVPEADGSVQWWPILGGILGFVALTCLLFYVWRVKSTPQQQSQHEDLVVPEEQKEKGEICYGEIDFSRQGASTSAQNVEQQQTIYSEVCMSKKKMGSAAAVVVNDDIYAQIEKH